MLPVENTALQSIRHGLRNKISLNRKLQRDAELNRSRLALGEWSDDTLFDEDFVVQTSRSLRKKTLSAQDYRKLQNALLQSQNHISAFFKVDHAVQGLIRDLAGTSAQSKLAAANCCCNLSLGDTRACTTICKFTAPYLIAELESTSQPLVEVCAWTIGNLVYGSSKAFSILHAQGCVKSLIKLAQQCSDDILPAVSYASLRYIVAGDELIDIADLIELGQIVVKRYPTVSDTDTLWLLAILSSKSACIEYLIPCISTVHGFLLEALSKEDQEIQRISAALRILSNAVSEPKGQVAQFMFEGGIEGTCSLLNILLSHQFIHIRKEAMWLLGNLYNHSIVTIQETTKTMIPILSSLKLAINSSMEET